MTGSELVWIIVISCFVGSVASGIACCRSGESYGYWQGCVDGSKKKSQLVEVDGVKRCLPHAQALEIRK